MEAALLMVEKLPVSLALTLDVWVFMELTRIPFNNANNYQMQFNIALYGVFSVPFLIIQGQISSSSLR